MTTNKIKSSTQEDIELDELFRQAHEMLIKLRHGAGFIMLVDTSSPKNFSSLFGGSDLTPDRMVVALAQAIIYVSQGDQEQGKRYLRALTETLSFPDVWGETLRNARSHMQPLPSTPTDPIQQKLEDTLRDITAPFRKAPDDDPMLPLN